MKQTLRSACVVLLISASFVAFNGCGSGNNSTTNADSTTTTTTDTVGTMNKMSDSSSMQKMTDSTKKDTGGRNTQNIPPPKKPQ